MPVYLCQAGKGKGIQVFRYPWPLDSTTTPSFSDDGDETGLLTGVGNPDRPLAPSAVGRATAFQNTRKIRHAELVLVDDVCQAHGRYWLKLRWPGQKGGFAGYVAMGLLSEQPAKFEGM